MRTLLRRLTKASLILRGGSPFPYRRCYRAYSLLDLYHSSPRDGVVVECGVGSGFSLGLLASACFKDARDIYAFDSFEGFPLDFDECINGVSRKALEGKYSNGLNRVKLRLSSMIGQDCVDHIHFVEGFFNKTLDDFDSSIGFLHLDVDLYESYAECLGKLARLCIPGAVILFDEYTHATSGGTDKFIGAKLAIDEFVKEYGLNLIHHPSGKYYVRMPQN